MTPAELADRLRLIVITDRDSAAPRSIFDVVEEALEAGAPAIQLRDKEASALQLYEAGKALLPRVREVGALFFVNDRVDVALALGFSDGSAFHKAFRRWTGESPTDFARNPLRAEEPS